MPTPEPALSPGQESSDPGTTGSSTSSEVVGEQQRFLSPKLASRGPTTSLLRFVPWKRRDGLVAEKGDVNSGAQAIEGQTYNGTPILVRARRALFGTRKRKLASIAAITVAMLLIILLSTLLTLLHRPASGAPEFVSHDTDTDPLIVDVSYGKYRGTPLSNGVVQWLGMRYSGPPTGQYRFAAPIPPVPFSGVQAADTVVLGCYGTSPGVAGANENCPSIDVYAPANASSTSQLPVYLFVQGGGNQDSTAHFNGSGLIESSGMNMIFATFTYRAGAFGFLASSEIQAHASLNNGYKDQRQAMQWIKDHIANFGGNPNAITVGGQSAGAGAVVAHLTAYGNTSNNGLFHSVIIESPSTPPIRTVSQQQFQYDDLVNNANCTGSNDTLACLRAVPYTTLLAHVENEPYPDGSGELPVFAWNPVIDDDFLPVDPISALSNGTFVSVPTLIGDVTNEGTIFVPQNFSNASGIEKFLSSNFPALNSSELTQLGTMYNLSSTDPPPYWHRAADVYGELRYTCPGTQVSNLLVEHGNTNVWRYRYDVVNPPNANTLGVYHGSELAAIFGDGPKSYQPGQINANIVPLMQDFWSSFVRQCDPNVYRENGAAVWEKWDPQQQQQIHLVANNSAMETVPSDQQQRCKYLASIAEALQQ